jgi:hypothetical protein
MNKTVFNVVPDIYNLVTTKKAAEGVDQEAEIERFGEAVKALMRKEFTEYQRDNRTLRLSSIGHPLKKLWHRVWGTPQEKIMGPTYIKFLYGHLIEELLVFLTRMAGHSVTDQQKECEVEGIKGHMDCRIDGIVTDVKSASSYSFKKFRNGTLAFDDPFGYVAQIKAYAYSEGETKYGWLAMDKQNGTLTYLLYDEEDDMSPVHNKINWDIAERIRLVKKTVGLSEAPQNCYGTLPDGKSGNQKLAVGCSYCDYKQSCWPGLRAFSYGQGPKFLATVVREPKVNEIKLAELVDPNENL